MVQNRICSLFGIRYPVVQGGMVWCSGWRLASAVSEAGGLGLIGAGSMHPEVLAEHIQKCKKATDKPFGVNVPLQYPELGKIMEIITAEGVKIVFTSAGSPAKWTPYLKERGIKVAHVVSNTKFAVKCVEVGVDALVAEGFEAGGHNGREETATMVLVPHVRKMTGLPLLAAGGIGSGRAMLAAFALGAEGVQIGSRFAVSLESSAHDAFKRRVLDSVEGDTVLTLKRLAPVRMLRNGFLDRVQSAVERGASVDELRQLLGKGRAKKGIFEGDLEEGELEIGQVSALIEGIQPAAEIMGEIVAEFFDARRALCGDPF